MPTCYPTSATPRLPDGSAAPLLSVQGVEKHYGAIHALCGVDVTIAQGEIVALLGRNGAGKSTLISLVAGLVRPDAGRILVGGIDVLEEVDAARPHVGLAPQETGVYPTLTVEENLRYFGELARFRGAPLTRSLHDVAAAFSLSQLLRRRARALSGGERRRLHTAMIVMCRPRLLLLDEPTAGVDVQTRVKLLEVVRNLADSGVAVCYSTHYLSEVEQLAASVVILDAGRVAASGSQAELLTAHGEYAVEMRFTDGVPQLPDRHTRMYDGMLCVVTPGPPAFELAGILNDLGDASARLQSIELIKPSLESVFVHLTRARTDDGRRNLTRPR